VPTSSLPDVLVPVRAISDDHLGAAVMAAAELAQAGHHVEVVALEFDPVFDARVADLRARGEVPDAVSVVNLYREEVRAAERAAAPHEILVRRLARFLHRALSSSSVAAGRDAWAETAAVRVEHLVVLPEMLRSRAAEEPHDRSQIQVTCWSDGSIALRSRLRADGTAYQRDFLRHDGRAFLVEWCGGPRRVSGTAHQLDHARATVDRFESRSDWETALLADRAQRARAVVLAASPWADALVGRPRLTACATTRLDGGSAAAAVRRLGARDDA